ncbi:MAG: hypothetical protein N3G22_03850, partial [Candidatus Micrarchaeota archaeon]|nr:hypothetical protein [Candidatus Micrarchaeota archaeon]
MEVSDIVDAKGLSRFVKSRQNSDGGYTFARRLYGLEFPSSISETYFALSILSILKENVQHREKTLSYVKKISRGKELHSSPATAFYAISSFLLLGERPPHSASLVEWLRAAITEKRAMFNEPTSNWFSAEYYA